MGLGRVLALTPLHSSPHTLLSEGRALDETGVSYTPLRSDKKGEAFREYAGSEKDVGAPDVGCGRSASPLKSKGGQHPCSPVFWPSRK